MNIYKNLRIQICNILLVCSIMSGISNCVASEITGTEVFDLIKTRDQVIRSEISKTATFKILTHASMFDPNQGFLLKDCALTWEKNNMSMKIVYDYLQDTVYVPPDSGDYAYQSIDYDKDKRLIVWRVLEEYIISKPEKTEKLTKAQLFYVSPNGDIEKSSGFHTTKQVFRANSKNEGNGDFKFFLLAAGLSFSDYIDANNMNLMKMPNENIIEINARGTLGKNRKDTKGTWELTVDPNAGYFIRKASYTGEGLNRPSIKVSTSDIVKKDGLEYANKGHIAFDDFDIRDYANIDISLGDNQELRQEVNQHMEAPLASGSEIIDFNEGKPTRMTVK